MTRSTTFSPVKLGTEGTWADFEDFILAMGDCAANRTGKQQYANRSAMSFSKSGTVAAPFSLIR